jgi:alkaline phosphatase
MNRRKFFRNGSLLSVGATLLHPVAQNLIGISEERNNNKSAKNIIILVSDGMSQGTLTMGNLYHQRKLGKLSPWIQLYHDNKVTRGLMDMASASSMITDSAAASSSWGSGFRIKNGALNIGTKGEEYLPIWQKFKKSGKKAGCVTTVPITHATPAGFMVSSKSRNSQEEIAEKYLEQQFDVLLGGGAKYFDAKLRSDKKDLFASYQNKGYQVVKNRTDLLNAKTGKPILGTFFDDALPYNLDRENIKDLANVVPTLAEMTQKAIELMDNTAKGFVLQVEAGKVDWAAHANCIGGLLYDQIAFEEALNVAIDFAEKDKNTLIIITSDHGNANPGLNYGTKADSNFDSIQKFKQTNEIILNSFSADSTVRQIIEKVEFSNSFVLNPSEAEQILTYYKDIQKQEDGVYNYRKLPFELFANIQKMHTSVSWIGTDHSADYTEIAMMGPGSELHKPFIKNTDLHNLMLIAAGVENKF